LSPFPGAWCMAAGERLKVVRSTLTDGSGAPGTVLEAGARLVVACGSGAVDLLQAQREGRRTMAAEDLLRGLPLTPGMRLDSP